MAKANRAPLSHLPLGPGWAPVLDLNVPDTCGGQCLGLPRPKFQVGMSNSGSFLQQHRALKKDL
jgi:hypothetical protein